MWQSVLRYFWKKAKILGLFKQGCFSLLPASTMCTSVSRWLPVFLLGLFLTDVDEVTWSLRLAWHVSLEISVNSVLQFAVEGLVQQTSEAVQAVRVVGQTEFTGGHKQSKTPELLKFGGIYEISAQFQLWYLKVSKFSFNNNTTADHLSLISGMQRSLTAVIVSEDGAQRPRL